MVGLAALAQYFQAYLALPRLQPGKEPAPAERMARQMVFLAPGITFFIFYNLPSAVSLYWLVATLFSVVQQIIINRTHWHTVCKVYFDLGTRSGGDNLMTASY